MTGYVPKVGDRIRVTREGIVTQLSECGAGSFYLDDLLTHPDRLPNCTVELLAPAEPPVGSVVVTRNDVTGERMAWKRTADGWYAATLASIRHTWEQVTAGRTVVHVETPDGVTG